MSIQADARGAFVPAPDERRSHGRQDDDDADRQTRSSLSLVGRKLLLWPTPIHIPPVRCQFHPCAANSPPWAADDEADGRTDAEDDEADGR